MIQFHQILKKLKSLINCTTSLKVLEETEMKTRIVFFQATIYEAKRNVIAQDIIQT